MVFEKKIFKDFGRNLYQSFWRKTVSKFWRKIVSKILEENSSKDFWGKLFQIFLKIYIYIYIFFLLSDKSGNLSKIVSVLLSASVKKFFVPRMLDFFLWYEFEVCITFWDLNLIAIWVFSLVNINLLVIM